jgi:DNA-binding GntR family transcriptional regulator
VRKPGVSTPVVTAKVRRPIELASLYDDLNTAGRDSHTSVLSFTIVKASDSTARALSIPEGVAVYAVERLRYLRNIPLALMRHEVPASIVTFTEKDLENGACTRSCAATAPLPGSSARRSVPGRQRRPRHGF